MGWPDLSDWIRMPAPTVTAATISRSMSSAPILGPQPPNPRPPLLVGDRVGHGKGGAIGPEPGEGSSPAAPARAAPFAPAAPGSRPDGRGSSAGSAGRAGRAPGSRRSGSAGARHWHCPFASSATTPPPSARPRRRKGIAGVGNGRAIPARTADIEDLGDERPESDLWSECPFAAVRAAFAPGRQAIGKQVAKELVKLTQRSEVLNFADQLARTTAKK